MMETAEELIIDKTRHYSYPSMTKTMGNFKLTVEAGSFTDSEIIVMLGENGTGKTTFVRLLAGVTTPDDEADKMELAVSLKPQTISPKFPGTVRMLLLKQIKAAFMHPQFQTDVLKPMTLDNIMDQDVKTLSGGELQRVAIVLALGERFFRFHLALADSCLKANPMCPYICLTNQAGTPISIYSNEFANTKLKFPRL